MTHADVTASSVTIRDSKSRVGTTHDVFPIVWVTPEFFVMLSNFLTPAEQAAWCDHAAAELIGLSLEILDRAATAEACS